MILKLCLFFHIVFRILLLVILIYLTKACADRLPRLGKSERYRAIFLLSFTCDYVVSIRSFLLFLVHGIGCVMILWHSLGLPYNYCT